MRKNYILPFLLGCIIVSFSANAQVMQWAKAGTQCGSPGSGVTEAGPLAIDPHSNVYISGNFSTPCASFGTDTMYSTTYAPIFLAKYDSSGHHKWVRYPTSGNNGQSMGIAADDSGNIYDAGVFYMSTIQFGAYTLTATGTPSNYLVKYDSSGNVLWARNCGGASKSCNVCVSRDGNIYITGGFTSSTFTAGSFTLSNASSGAQDGFIVKYTPAGSVVWARHIGSTGDDQGSRVSCDLSGNVYVCGSFQSTSISIGSSTLINSGSVGSDLFLAKYSSAGTPLWGRSIKLSQDTIGYSGHASITADDAGNVYVSGGFATDSVVIGSHHFNNYNPGPGSGTDIFLAKYDPSGSVLWAQHAGGKQVDQSYDFVIDLTGSIWLTGGSYSDSITLDTSYFAMPPTAHYDASFIAKFDAGGHLLYKTTLKVGGDDYFGLAIDHAGSMFVGGDYMDGPHYLGQDTLNPIGQENFFVAKLSEVFDPSKLKIASVVKDDEIKLLPNPANNELTIETVALPGSGAAVTICNAYGQSVKTILLTDKKTSVSTSDMAAGLYFCHVAMNGTAVVKKLVICH